MLPQRAEHPQDFARLPTESCHSNEECPRNEAGFPQGSELEGVLQIPTAEQLGTTETPWTRSCTLSLPWHTSGWQGFGASVTPLQQHLGQHHLQPHEPAPPPGPTKHPPSPLLSFLKTKILGKQPCRLRLIARRDLSSLVSPTLPPNPLFSSLFHVH